MVAIARGSGCTALESRDHHRDLHSLFYGLDEFRFDQTRRGPKLCLSCHDGTVALDSYSRMTGTTTIGTVRTDRRSSHPISMTYDSALATADGTLFDPVTKTTSLGGTVEVDLLRLGKVQCTSCHDVHNRYDNEYLLRINNAGSALCITCHNK